MGLAASIPQSLLHVTCFVLYICYISCEGVLSSCSSLDRWIDPIIHWNMSSCLLWPSGWLPKSWLFTDIALVNFSSSLAVKGATELGLGKDIASSSSLEMSPCATGGVYQKVLLHPELDVCSGRNQNRKLGACYGWGITQALPTVCIIPCFQISVLKQTRAFSKEGKIYNLMGKITHITAVLWDLWCDWKACMEWVSQSSPVTFLFAVQLDQNLRAPSSRGGWRCHKSNFHTPLGLSSWRSTCGKWHPACICMLALAKKQQAEISSICSLNRCSLPVSRPSNREDWETMQYISMSSGIYESWICSRVSK